MRYTHSNQLCVYTFRLRTLLFIWVHVCVCVCLHLKCMQSKSNRHERSIFKWYFLNVFKWILVCWSSKWVCVQRQQYETHPNACSYASSMWEWIQTCKSSPIPSCAVSFVLLTADMQWNSWTQQQTAHLCVYLLLVCDPQIRTAPINQKCQQTHYRVRDPFTSSRHILQSSERLNRRKKNLSMAKHTKNVKIFELMWILLNLKYTNCVIFPLIITFLLLSYLCSFFFL